MFKMPRGIGGMGLSLAVLGVLSLSAGSAQAVTNFQKDVATAINNGLGYLAGAGVFNNPSSVGPNGASGIAMEALLEKRPSGNPADPPQGYNGATPADQALLRTAAAFILDQTANVAGYAYRDGSWMFALSGYALTGGPDKSVLAPGNPSYQTIKQAMDTLVDRTLSQQNAAGYWCYGPLVFTGCSDSSTTQFATAGLNAARVFYKSNKSADDVFADAGRAAQIDTALANAKTAYELNNGTGSDNAGCNVLTLTERGHGYHPTNEGYKPSLQQTASGIYIQLFGGANVNSPNVQAYIEWLRNRYRWDNLDSMGNFWPSNSYGYYLWSSFKAMELIRQQGIAPNPGNIGPNDLGTLPAASAPACAAREVNKDPAAYPQVPLFGAGPVGYYKDESKGQYFDYAHQIISMQCPNGSFTCTGFPGSWGDSFNTSHNSYALLVLQRATGVIVQVCDVDGDGKVTNADLVLIRNANGQVPTGPEDPRDANRDGKINVLDVRFCQLRLTP